MEKTLSKQLLSDAVKNGLCKPFQKAWKDKTLIEYVRFYKKHPDWCLERKYPSFEFLKKHFDLQEVRDNQVYIDCECNLELTEPVYIFNNCKCNLLIQGYEVSQIYIALDSVVDIEVKDHAILYVDIYDGAKVNITGNARVKYGKTV